LPKIDGSNFWRFYFRFSSSTVKALQIYTFLAVPCKQVHHQLLIIRDAPLAHRSVLVRQYVNSLKSRIVLEQLSAYTPEVNPAEYLWAYAKQRESAILCRDTIRAIHGFVRNHIEFMQHTPHVITACW
jgi:hypothetical protein